MRVERRYNGPASSGNGGVTCGLLAQTVDAEAVEVTLRRPPPLERELRVQDGQLYDGEALVASAVPAQVSPDVPAPVRLDEARAAQTGYSGLQDHPFPTCFVCGTERDDGLGLRPGPVGSGVACTWTPYDDDPVMVWAALDCPGGWSADLPGRPMVLGRMALRLLHVPVPGEPHVVQGWTTGGEGRKTTTGSAVHDASGTLLAVARATWIAVDPATL